MVFIYMVFLCAIDIVTIFEKCRLTIKVRNGDISSPGQVVYVVMTYKAPADVNTEIYDSAAAKQKPDWDLYKRVVKNYKRF